MAEKNTVGKYKKPIPKRMLKEFDRKRPFSSAGPATKGPTGKTPKKYFGHDLPIRKKDMGDDLPMSKEGSPTVTDTETGKVTYGKPEKFEHGGMASCRGMGKAIKGGKFIGVK